MRYSASRLKLFFIHIILVFPMCVWGQTYDQITTSSEYVYGEGEAASAVQADRQALAAISEQISVKVRSEFEIHNRKTTNDIINTYSSSTLTNCKKMVLENGPERYRILRYVHNDEIARMFKSRELKVLEMVGIAQRAEEERKYDVALKHYYWAQLLLETLTYPNEVYCDAPDGSKQEVVLYIPLRMNEILDGLAFEFGGYASDDKTLATIYVTYKGAPVSSLDYTYWDGINWSAPTQARDGLSAVELRANSNVSSINIKIEHMYEQEMYIDPDFLNIAEYFVPKQNPKSHKNSIQLIDPTPAEVVTNNQENLRVQDVVTGPNLVNAEAMAEAVAAAVAAAVVEAVSGSVVKSAAGTPAATVAPTTTSEVPAKSESAAPAEGVVAEAESAEEGATVQAPVEVAEESAETAAVVIVENIEHYKATIGTIVKAINGRKYESARPYFTEEGYDIYSKLITYGRAKTLSGMGFNPLESIEVVKFEDSYICRSIPMQFSFSGNKSFVESVVFVFNEEGKIASLQFGLERITVNDILSKSQWSTSAKLILINFLENYRTAFALSRIDYLDSIFSEDALIITGRVVTRTNVEGQINLQNQKQIILNRQTKSEYINNLRRSFKSKEYINLQFSNLEILKMDRGANEIYCMEIKQDYYSSNYADTGYLTLVVDVTERDLPIIHVRTWLPEPDPQFGVFSAGHF